MARKPAQGAGCIFGLVDAALLQFRHDEVDEARIASGVMAEAQIEAIDIGPKDPASATRRLPVRVS